MSRPPKGGPRLHEGGLRHRGAGWEAIRSHLGRTCPRHEGNGTTSFLHAPPLSVTESGFLSGLALRFLTRPGCHLCDEARPLVTSVAAKLRATVIELDVDEDDVLVSLYGLRIPVVLGPGDEVVAEGIIRDARSFQKAVRRLTGR